MLPTGVWRPPSANADGDSWLEETVVLDEAQEVPEDCLENDVDSEYCLPRSKFELTWKLPTSLSQCRQSVHERDGDWISVSHRCIYTIQFTNPEKDITNEVTVTVPIVLYISPRMAVGDDGVVATTTIVSAANVVASSTATPRYVMERLNF